MEIGELCTRWWLGNQRKRDHWGYQDVGGRIILIWILKEGGSCCGDWMDLAQDRERWRVLVSMVMNFGVT
jgi:hypothetical protein